MPPLTTGMPQGLDQGSTCKCPNCGTMLKLEASQPAMPKPGGNLAGDQDAAPDDMITQAAGGKSGY